MIVRRIKNVNVIVNVIVIKIDSERKDQYQEKNKVGIRINHFFLFHDFLYRGRVFFNRCRYIQIIRIFLRIFFMINEFTFFISRIKTIKCYFMYNHRLKRKLKSRFNQIHLF